eukprot:TRINITY_DN1541_c0_g1_i1.p1 TRINITY_DN1541_c0_g1~~TRINITY_DN1541_c0_g1_i1.p1  ORF type:complete len:198 (-),score=53.89 TRINITY_DN1541_c0_g1_i1:109-702(-)
MIRGDKTIVRVQDCQFQNNSVAAIEVETSTRVMVHGCTMRGNGCGVRLHDSATGVTVTRTTFACNKGPAICAKYTTPASFATLSITENKGMDARPIVLQAKVKHTLRDNVITPAADSVAIERISPDVTPSIQRAIDANRCTYYETGPYFVVQPKFQCLTCHKSNYTYCIVCAKGCHAGHDVVVTGEGAIYCDCKCSH